MRTATSLLLVSSLLLTLISIVHAQAPHHGYVTELAYVICFGVGPKCGRVLTSQN
jgi:hypothetical membrane protein